MAPLLRTPNVRCLGPSIGWAHQGAGRFSHSYCGGVSGRCHAVHRRASGGLRDAGTPSKTNPTTTTTAPGKNAAAIAKLVIKASSVGYVSVKTAGGSTFKPAKNGQSLHVGDTVQSDATGQTEIDYADSAYTRLDVNTTFTIKKLTDAQGNRQVEGSLDVGRTYNRTAALTQSQTFQQDGGGATAAVAGTASVVTCTSATSCTFRAVVDNIDLTGAGAQTKTLNPLDQCDANSGALCGTNAHLTPDESALIEWIQQNVYLDLAEHGIGNGVFQPFAGTVVVNGAVVQSFTPATSNQGFTPQTPPNNPSGPPPAPHPTVDQTNPVCTPPGTACVPQPNLTTPDDDATNTLSFQLNGGTDRNGQSGLSYQYTQLNLPNGTRFDTNFHNSAGDMATLYSQTTTFKYTPTSDNGGATDSFKYQVVDNHTGATSPTATQASVNIAIQDSDGDST